MTKYAYVTTVLTTRRTYVISEDELQQFNLLDKPDLSWATDSIVCKELDDFIYEEEFVDELILNEHWLNEAQVASLCNDWKDKND